MFLSGFTTVVGPDRRWWSRVRGLSEFGLDQRLGTADDLRRHVPHPAPTARVGARLGLLRARAGGLSRWTLVPPAGVTVAMLVTLAVAAGLAPKALSFDYDLSKLEIHLPAATEVHRRHRAVYGTSAAPAAVYVAPNLGALDRALDAIEQSQRARWIPDHRLGEERARLRAGRLRADGARVLIAESGAACKVMVARIPDDEIRDLVGHPRCRGPHPAPSIDKPSSVTRHSCSATTDGASRCWCCTPPVVSTRADGHGLSDELRRLPLYGELAPRGEKPASRDPAQVTGEGPPDRSDMDGIAVLVWVDRRSLAQTLMCCFRCSRPRADARLHAAARLETEPFNIVVLPP